MKQPEIHDPSLTHQYLVPDKTLPFPVKVNVHFPLRGELHHIAVRANEMVKSVTLSEIDLTAVSFQIPHVTIYMGFVDRLSHLHRVMEATSALADRLQPKRITITPPYLKEPTQKWAFIDVAEKRELVALKRDFYDRIREWVIPLSWNIVEEPPHITIGYIKDRFSAVAEELKKLAIDPTRPFVLDAIELSFGGIRGSCLGSVRTYELGRAAASNDPRAAAGTNAASDYSEPVTS